MARPRSESARQKVIAAALEEIAELGVGGCTIDAVAKRSGVAKTTIYRHWASCNDLIVEACHESIGPFPTPNTGSLRADLIVLYAAFAPMMDDPSFFRMALGMIARSEADEDFRKLKAKMMKERHHPIQTVLELAMARGELSRDINLDWALTVIEGPFVATRILRGERIPTESIPKFVDAALHGLLGQQTKGATL